MNRRLFFALCLFLGACQTDSPDHTTSSNAQPADGDAYVEGSIGDASVLNPILSTDSASNDINSLVYNGLLKYDKNLVLIGDLAESWTISPDGLSITFQLRKNVRWHDGEPFTAQDVEFTYQKLIDPNVRTPFSGDYLLVKKFEVLSPHSFRVTYKERFSPALESWGMGIVPKHIYEKGDFNNHPANRNPIGTGPYKFTRWDTDEKIILEANPDYFEGRPHIQRYVYRIIPDQAVQFLELRNQSIDVMTLTPDMYNAYGAFFKRYNKYRYPAFQYSYLAFNMKNPLFQSKKVRQALAQAVNKKEIIQGLLLGYGQEATGPFPPASWAYNPDVKSLPYDPQKALALLKEEGWEDHDGDGILDKDGKPFRFTILSNQGNKLRAMAAEVIQQHLKKIGVSTEIRILEWSTFLHNYVDKKNFDAVILAWSLARDPDNYPMWHSSQTKEGQYNFISYSNPEVDQLIEQGRREFDKTKRQAIYRKIHALIADDQPYIFLYVPDALPVIHKRFRGVEPAPIGLGWNFIHWYAPKEEQKYLVQ